MHDNGAVSKCSICQNKVYSIQRPGLNNNLTINESDKHLQFITLNRTYESALCILTFKIYKEFQPHTISKLRSLYASVFFLVNYIMTPTS